MENRYNLDETFAAITNVIGINHDVETFSINTVNITEQTVPVLRSWENNLCTQLDMGIGQNVLMAVCTSQIDSVYNG